VAVPTIIQALDDPRLFAPFFRGPTWDAWRAFLAVLFALPVDDAQRTLYATCTGRTALPTEPFKEAELVVGRRGGKSRILALLGTYLATFRDYTAYLAPGEVATVSVIAADRRQARTIMRYVTGLFRAVDLLRPMVIGTPSDETIALNNRVVIEIQTASWRVTRGYTFAAVLADETAFWRDDTSANPDVEIFRAIRPGLSTIPGAMLLNASSPYRRAGVLYTTYRRHYGKEGARVLVWQGPTGTMNLGLDPAVIAEAY
jgi:phage terminase large subunit-like protein